MSGGFRANVGEFMLNGTKIQASFNEVSPTAVAQGQGMNRDLFCEYYSSNQ